VTPANSATPNALPPPPTPRCQVTRFQNCALSGGTIVFYQPPGTAIGAISSNITNNMYLNGGSPVWGEDFAQTFYAPTSSTAPPPAPVTPSGSRCNTPCGRLFSLLQPWLDAD